MDCSEFDLDDVSSPQAELDPSFERQPFLNEAGSVNQNFRFSREFLQSSFSSQSSGSQLQPQQRTSTLTTTTESDISLQSSPSHQQTAQNNYSPVPVHNFTERKIQSELNSCLQQLNNVIAFMQGYRPELLSRESSGDLFLARNHLTLFLQEFEATLSQIKTNFTSNWQNSADAMSPLHLLQNYQSKLPSLHPLTTFLSNLQQPAHSSASAVPMTLPPTNTGSIIPPSQMPQQLSSTATDTNRSVSQWEPMSVPMPSSMTSTCPSNLSANILTTVNDPNSDSSHPVSSILPQTRYFTSFSSQKSDPLEDLWGSEIANISRQIRTSNGRKYDLFMNSSLCLPTELSTPAAPPSSTLAPVTSNVLTSFATPSVYSSSSSLVSKVSQTSKEVFSNKVSNKRSIRETESKQKHTKRLKPTENVTAMAPTTQEKVPKTIVSVFRVNPSKSKPHTECQRQLTMRQGGTMRVPATLQNTMAPSMMYHFNLKKERKEAEKRKKKSIIASSLPSTHVTLKDFEFLQTLGMGTFGRVKLCVHKETHQYYCMKILRKQVIYRYKQVEHLQNERNVLRNVRHPGIVQLFATFRDDCNIYFLMEYVPGGELFMYIRKFGKLDEHIVKFYAAELVLILEYLHSKSIVYRDLKPENVLLDERGHIKLTDFGFSKMVTDRTWTMCGTPDYLAPEIISGIGHSFAVDWWSLGVLIFEMLAGYPPFTDHSTLALFEKIRNAESLVMPAHFSSSAVDLIRRFLRVDPTRRLGHTKGGVQEIKEHAFFADVNWQVCLFSLALHFVS